MPVGLRHVAMCPEGQPRDPFPSHQGIRARLARTVNKAQREWPVRQLQQPASRVVYERFRVLDIGEGRRNGLGRHLVVMFETNGDVPTVKQSETDMDARALVKLSGVSRKRQSAVFLAMGPVT